MTWNLENVFQKSPVLISMFVLPGFFRFVFYHMFMGVIFYFTMKPQRPSVDFVFQVYYALSETAFRICVQYALHVFLSRMSVPVGCLISDNTWFDSEHVVS